MEDFVQEHKLPVTSAEDGPMILDLDFEHIDGVKATFKVELCEEVKIDPKDYTFSLQYAVESEDGEMEEKTLFLENSESTIEFNERIMRVSCTYRRSCNNVTAIGDDQAYLKFLKGY